MATKVLVVDDAFTMRALISTVLGQIKGIEVVGAANGADEARDELERLKPDVMTLDIEMPGMSGIQFLAEVMEKKPIPTIMFSTLTEAGASASIEALRLGAVGCFPKPKVATQNEFNTQVMKLADCIKKAKATEVKKNVPPAADAPPPVVTALDWNGRLVAISTEPGGTKDLFAMLGAFPSNCPPTILLPQLRAELVDSLAKQLAEHIKPEVVMMSDGIALEQGKIYLCPPGEAHVMIDGWPDGRLRKLVRDPLAGERPSASLLFASIAKSAAAEGIGIMLGAPGDDGPAGLKAINAAGGFAFAPDGVLPASSPLGFGLYKGIAAQKVELNQLATNVLKLCSK